jgi:hypothetical protein
VTGVQTCALPISIRNGKEFPLCGAHKISLNGYLKEKPFNTIVSYLSDTNETFQKIAHVLQRDYQPSAVVPVIPFIPVKKKFEINHYDDSLLITTVCDENYQWYVPMFLKCIEVTVKQKVIPRVFIRGEIDNAMRAACGDNAKYIIPLNMNKYPNGGYATAASRFLINPFLNETEMFQYTLITDVDIMMYHESMSIIDAHMMHLNQNKTEMYENWISEYRGDNARLPGVHFVTSDWWKRTEKARDHEREEIIKLGNIADYWYDEIMLGRIVKNSGLLLPPTEAKLWRHHGVHIGDWRLNVARNQLPRPNVFEGMHIQWMLTDPEFSALLDLCGTHLEIIPKVKKMWPMLFR